MIRKDLITLSQEEHDRLQIIRKVMKREISQVEAADLLNISDRQVRTLVGKVREKGAKGMAHGNRGQESPRKMARAEEGRIAGIIKDKYWDFGPTFAAEKLWEKDKIKVSKEKLRQVMIDAEIWRVRHRKGNVHQWRERKHFSGELVQMDGSHHDWLEGRGPKLVLMGYIDDARNEVFGRFYDYEGIWPAMDSLEGYIRLYGIPRALYLDKLSTYKTTRPADLDELLRGEEAQTQFERAGKELGINIIHAESPQAKGRIERLWGTLQDRLTKEMRLAGITSLEEANAFLPGFTLRYNARFARAPQDPNSAWMTLPADLDANYYFAVRESRKVRADHCISFSGRILQLLPDPKGRGLVDESVTVHTVPEGAIHLYHGRQPIPYRPLPIPEAAPPKPPPKAVRQPKPSDPKAAARRRAWLFAGRGQPQLDRKEALGVP